MITIQSAQQYSMQQGKEMAYALTYSDGTEVRAVEAVGGIIRKEYKTPTGWKLSGKPYVVVANKKRHAERTKNLVLNFLQA